MGKYKNDMGSRMKGYEKLYRGKLMSNNFAILRVDGNNFKKFTKNFNKPFDHRIVESMEQTLKQMCEEIQGVVMGYQQSDEITILINDYGYKNNGYMGYDINKINSLTSVMAGNYFNEYLREFYGYEGKLARFDCRVFSIPNHDVINNFLWRQQDFIRNSILMVSHNKFGHKKIINKNTYDLKEMLLDFDIDWNNFESKLKYGTFCYKVERESIIKKGPNIGEKYMRKVWELDSEKKVRDNIEFFTSLKNSVFDK